MAERARRLGLAVLVVALPGCSWWRPNPFAETAACHLPDDTPQIAIVQHLNARAARLSGWRAMNARVTYSGPEGTHTLNAQMAVQAPRNFSLTCGTTVTGTEVELGSNDERFWFWAKRSQHKSVLYSDHENLTVAQQRFPIPFQPDWIMEALGVAPIDESNVEVQDVPSDSRQRLRRVWLVSNCVSPQGEPVKKVTLVDACHGLPLKHELIGQDSRRIATATLLNYRPDRQTGEPIPGTIALEWPEARMSITIALGEVDLNPTFPPQAWTMPEYRDCPLWDIGRQPPPGRTVDASQSRPHHSRSVDE